MKWMVGGMGVQIQVWGGGQDMLEAKDKDKETAHG